MEGMEPPVKYPRNLAYACERLSGYSTNSFKLETTSGTIARPGSVISVNLPSNSLIDLCSLKWVVNAAVGGLDNTATTGGRLVFPHAATLISRMEVYVNGSQVSGGLQDYGSVFRVLRNCRSTVSKASSIDTSMQMGALDETGAASGAAVAQTTSFVLQDWLGMFSSDISTRFIHTGLTGMINIKITLADGACMTPVCSGVSTELSTTALGLGNVGHSTQTLVNLASSINAYSLDQFYFTIQCISLNDGFYDKMLKTRLAEDGYLPFSFFDYQTTTMDGITTPNFAVRFACNTQSLNKIYAAFRPSNYTDRGRAASVCGRQSDGTFAELYQPSFLNFQSFANTVAPSSSSRIAKTLDMANNNAYRWQFTINNVAHNQYLCSEVEGLANLLYAENRVGFYTVGNQITTRGDYRYNKFALVLRLNHAIDGENRAGYISGFDTRSTNANMVLNMSGATGIPAGIAANNFLAANALIFCETTTTLRIGPGSTIQAIP